LKHRENGDNGGGNRLWDPERGSDGWELINYLDVFGGQGHTGIGFAGERGF
jgi:hypothetical protein